MDERDLDHVLRAMPIFPLPNAVLMPGASLPLHVFEPRYRALVSHAREQGGVFGVATLQPGFEGGDRLPPPIFPEIGLGEIVDHQPLPDGRCNLVLQFVASTRMVAEVPSDHPFRLVHAERVTCGGWGAEEPTRHLRWMVLQVGGVSPEASAEARRLVALSPEDLVDSLARRLLHDHAAQRAYLAARSARSRVEMVQGRLADFMTDAPPVAMA